MMRNIIAIVATLLLTMGLATQVEAQNYMVVNSQLIFKSLDEYNKATEEVDALGKQYQKNIDEAYAKVEEMFNQYQEQKGYLSQTTRNERENLIIENEKRINEYQEKVFGQGGDLMKRRVELIKPIQDNVFETIEKFAKANSFGLVMDLASNPSLIYYSPGLDKTMDIIKLLGGNTNVKEELMEEIKREKLEDIEILN